ncbi:Uma2 family endonuclease [Larkinella sp. VNQ87]|uniref:Uma2 family endonuclease n=1 Tax=Larkinella sp. VNQ87 TaxID=3400921 RepID=UPI003C0B1425
MEAVEKKKRNVSAKMTQKVPAYLVAEELDGKPVYYKGYRDVLSGTKTIEDIMGASELQSLVASVILEYLYDHLDRKKYQIASNELGLHIEKRNNLSMDVVVYEKEQFKTSPISRNYSVRPPRVVIEIDIEGDFPNQQEFANYYLKKTQKLLDFGVRQVIWFFTDVRKVVIAEPGKPWLTVDWQEEIMLFNHYRFSIKNLLESSGLPFNFEAE